jgi:signal transduction histidine kinase
MAEIAVEDHGQGIPAEDLVTIFDRFRQGSGVHAGLGLGLYIAREIVVRHGGTLEVASKVGKGSTFTVRIPLLENEND